MSLPHLSPHSANKSTGACRGLCASWILLREMNRECWGRDSRERGWQRSPGSCWAVDRPWTGTNGQEDSSSSPRAPLPAWVTRVLPSEMFRPGPSCQPSGHAGFPAAVSHILRFPSLLVSACSPHLWGMAPGSPIRLPIGQSGPGSQRAGGARGGSAICRQLLPDESAHHADMAAGGRADPAQLPVAPVVKVLSKQNRDAIGEEGEDGGGSKASWCTGPVIVRWLITEPLGIQG